VSGSEAGSTAGRERPRRTNRPALSLEAIIDATIAIIDADGLDAVSMRRVAATFDTGPASLYAYVASKQDLFEKVLDRVLTEGEIPDADTWQDMLRGWAQNAREVFQRHQDIARLSFAYIPHGDAMVDAAEKGLRVMVEGGVPPQVAAWALDIMSLYIGADAYEGWLLGKRFADDSGRPPEEVAQHELDEVKSQFEALPADRFPFMNRYAHLLMTGDSDERFAFGIDMLIAGFEAQIPPRA
jgi:AcrR family transcriptional regulator